MKQGCARTKETLNPHWSLLSPAKAFKVEDIEISTETASDLRTMKVEYSEQEGQEKSWTLCAGGRPPLPPDPVNARRTVIHCAANGDVNATDPSAPIYALRVSRPGNTQLTICNFRTKASFVTRGRGAGTGKKAPVSEADEKERTVKKKMASRGRKIYLTEPAFPSAAGLVHKMHVFKENDNKFRGQASNAPGVSSLAERLRDASFSEKSAFAVARKLQEQLMAMSLAAGGGGEIIRTVPGDLMSTSPSSTGNIAVARTALSSNQAVLVKNQQDLSSTSFSDVVERTPGIPPRPPPPDAVASTSSSISFDQSRQASGGTAAGPGDDQKIVQHNIVARDAKGREVPLDQKSKNAIRVAAGETLNAQARMYDEAQVRRFQISIELFYHGDDPSTMTCMLHKNTMWKMLYSVAIHRLLLS